MKMDIILKSVLYESFWEQIAESSFVGSELEIDERLARDNCDHISKKCHSGDQSSEIISAWSSEMFLDDSCEECWEH